jgi:hypothetical protein
MFRMGWDNERYPRTKKDTLHLSFISFGISHPRFSASGRLPHGIYHPKSGKYHLKYIPWYIQKRKMVYIMVYTIDIYHGIYHYYHGIYHRYIPWYI